MRGGAVWGSMLLAVVMAAGVAAAAGVAGTGGTTPAAERAGAKPAYVGSVLTAGGDAYRIAARADRVVIRASGQARDPNRREVFHRRGAREVRDQTACATWERRSSELAQEGIALRIRTGPRGGVRAITLTKNTVFNVHSVFNVLTWDTRRSGDPWRRAGQFDMADALVDDAGALRPLPWRVCLRATGRVVGFKVWFPESMAQPSWRSARFARRTTVPRAFLLPGVPGWYVGHVPDGGSVAYRDLTTR